MSEDIETIPLPSRYGLIAAPAKDLIIGRSIATYGEWAQLEIDALAYFIKDGDTVLDVGACFGAHSLAFSDLAGPSGRMIAFEASPTDFAVLNRNCRNTKGAPFELMRAIVGTGDAARFVSRDNEENRGSGSVQINL